VSYDPTIYRGAAAFYAQGRPPYSAELVGTLDREVGLDHGGRLLDVGCGPGILTVELAPHVGYVVGLDPDADMLTEAARRAREHGVSNVAWVRALAEDLPSRPLGPYSLVTFAQSFQWTDRERVAEAVYDLLEPGGSIVLLAPTVAGRPKPPSPGYPPIPHDEITQLVDRYLGPRRRAGQGFSKSLPDRYEDALARTRFGAARIVFAPGRPDIVRDVDSVVAGYFSMSWAAPHLFGDERLRFEADLRALLHTHAPAGRFWDWPGDTELVIATKPA
jgi:ubiquinone/menaquinone biosynthesis C-methylase UbiE